MKLRLFALALATSLVLRAADAPPAFNATLTVGKEHRFILISTAGQSSPFLKLGESFEGYALKTYDAKAAALDLERDGQIVRLTLASDATVANAPAAPTPATFADATALLNKMHFEQLMERSLARQKKSMVTMAEQMSARMNMPGVDKEAVATFQQKVMTEMMSALDPGQMKDDMAKIYSETFTKDEVDGLSVFYDTPLGQALLEKQQTVQERLAATMQPRIVAMMPKIQQMAKEFAMEQKAKRDAVQGTITVVAPRPAPKP